MLTDNAIQIWEAGVQAVTGDRLIANNVHVAGDRLRIASWEKPIAGLQRIHVVGGGKAAARMAMGVEAALAPLHGRVHLAGWVHTFEETSEKTDWIRLWKSRPQGRNEPTAKGVQGTKKLLKFVSSPPAVELCLALITGGASAMLVCPVEGVPLAEKQAIARLVGAGGGGIRELNLIRMCLSQVKGGGLRRASRAKDHVTLLISDVLGDSLDVIGSSPMLPCRLNYSEALRLLEIFDSHRECPRARNFLERQVQSSALPELPAEFVEHERARHFVLGNLETARQGAATWARAQGFQVEMMKIHAADTDVEVEVRRCLEELRTLRSRKGAWCLIGGGEPTVKLVDALIRGQGGRNQQFVTALLACLQAESRQGVSSWCTGDWAVVSAGTDGEDGPTDAAGGYLDPGILRRSLGSALDIQHHLRHNNTYPYLHALNSLLRTGFTHTNVCDLRIFLSREP